MRRTLPALLVALWLLAAALSPAAQVPDAPLGRVSDFAAILSQDAAARIDVLLAEHERATGLQIAVAVFSSLAGDPIEDFSIRLAERWKIGREGKDDGVILVVALEERKIRIEVGYGLEGAITDGTAGEIIRNAIAPEFRKGDYAAGIEAGVRAIIEASKGEGGGAPAPSRDPIGTIVIVVIVFIVILLIVLSAIGGGMTLGPGGSTRHGGGFWGGGPFGGGFGGGGGFSGGGGSFGGGGASGGW